jgi:branched-chain amino acid transport system substrate-binding protein
VAIEEHKISTISEVESLTRIKAKNADVLVISSTPAPTAIILKDAKNMGMYPAMTIGCASASFTKALIDLAGANVVEGVYGIYHTVSWDDDVSGMAKATEYCQKNNRADYGNMDYFSTWTTCLVVREILAQAVKNAGYDVLAKGDAESWKAIEQYGIQKLKNYKVENLQGMVSYTPGDNRLGKYLRLYRISGGKIVAISDWQEAPLIKYEELDWFGK